MPSPCIISTDTTLHCPLSFPLPLKKQPTKQPTPKQTHTPPTKPPKIQQKKPPHTTPKSTNQQPNPSKTTTLTTLWRLSYSKCLAFTLVLVALPTTDKAINLVWVKHLCLRCYPEPGLTEKFTAWLCIGTEVLMRVHNIAHGQNNGPKSTGLTRTALVLLLSNILGACNQWLTGDSW